MIAATTGRMSGRTGPSSTRYFTPDPLGAKDRWLLTSLTISLVDRAAIAAFGSYRAWGKATRANRQPVSLRRHANTRQEGSTPGIPRSVSARGR